MKKDKLSLWLNLIITPTFVKHLIDQVPGRDNVDY